MRSDLAVLFDLDGVIVDSKPQHMAAWERWAREHAPDAPEGYFHRSFGLRNDAIISGLIEGLSNHDLQRLADRKEELFREQARGSLILLPGVLALLTFLDAHGVPKAIVTSTPRRNLDLVLRTVWLDGRFEALVAEEDTPRGKPHPEGFLLAAERLGIDARDCVVIEDAPAGLAAPRKPGCARSA